MTKALDAAGASAPEAGELARLIRYRLEFPDCCKASDLLNKHGGTIASLLLKLAETEKRLAEAARWFYEYEQHHRTKGNGEKAKINKARGDFCHALRSAATSGKEQKPCE
jgi:hypothetical protein